MNGDDPSSNTLEIYHVRCLFCPGFIMSRFHAIFFPRTLKGGNGTTALSASKSNP